MADNFIWNRTFPVWKKSGPSQIWNQYLCRSRNIRYLQAKLTGKAKKFEYSMKQGRDESRRVLLTKLLTGKEKSSTRLQNPCLSKR